ncbi:MAG: efflux RND transporter permease subunit [Anaerolineae bacterium]|nr:efflux RND transporter permease subunit [Anaerolineae bacterium]
MLESLIDRVTRLSLRFKWATIALSILALAAGGYALTQFNQELIPTIEFPQTVVLAFNSGAEPEAMRDEVTIPIEEALSQLDGVVNVESTTSAGVAFVIVRNNFGMDQEALRTDIQSALDGITFPSDMESPELLSFSFADLPVAAISISSSELSSQELKDFVGTNILPALEGVEDVASVQVSGGQELPEELPEQPLPEVTPEPTPEPTPTIEVSGVPLPSSWIAALSPQGNPAQTAEELTPDVVGGIAAFAPDMLADLTPEMLLAMPVEALAALPEEYFAGLDSQLAEELLSRISALGAPEDVDPDVLPVPWIAAAQAQDLDIEKAADVTPEFVQGLAGFAPELFDLLTPHHLRSFSPEVLAWLPAEYIATLDADLLAELEALAEPAGGLGVLAAAAAEAAAEMAAQSPALSGTWVTPPEDGAAPTGPAYETAADLINNGFVPTAAEFLNLFVVSGPPNTPELIHDLTPDVIAWLSETEEGFLTTLEPQVLRMLSPEVLQSLPVEFMESLDPELAVELAAIASGQAAAFIPTESITRTDGSPSLAVAIFKVGEANTVEVSHAIFDRLDQFAEEHPDLRFEVVFEQASFIEESIDGVTREGSLGAVFAVVIILLFLSGYVGGRYRLSWRSTIVTAVSIPLSVFMAFALMKWMPFATEIVLAPLSRSTSGIPVLGAFFTALHRLFPLDMTLNIMTLSGMTVAIGRVVDDSIVVLENIYRHIQRGEDMRESVLVGTRDVAIAIFASTVTTVIVFLPIGLLGGLIGEFFLPFGVAVTYALASSFLVAITIVPLLAYMFIRKEHLPEERETILQKAYTPVLKWSLRHRALTLAVATVFFLASMYLLAQRPRAFLPDFGEPQITATVDLQNGATMAETDALVMEFEELLLEMEGLGVVQSEIGSTGGFESVFFGSGVDQTAANVMVSVEDIELVDQLTDHVRESAQTVFGDESVIVSAGSLSSGAFGGFALILSGDPELLAEVNQDVIDTLNTVPGLANVSSNLADSGAILRVDGETAVRYTGELETEDALGVTAEAKSQVEAIVPGGILVSEGFETRQQTEGFGQALQAILVSIIAVYLVMIATFRSFVHPFTILFSLPLAIIGAAVALWLADRVLGLPVLVGLMMLVGIVVTNAIVLIDRVQANRKKRAMDTYDALVEGGRTRLRPILMTAIAAMLALVPLALGLTEGAIIAAELATVVIGGLFSSTLLTLVVVPVMFSLLEQLTNRRSS